MLKEIEGMKMLERPNIIYSEWAVSSQRVLKNLFEGFQKEVLFVCDYQTEGMGTLESVTLCSTRLGSKENEWDSHLGNLIGSLTRVIKPQHVVFVQVLMSYSLAMAINEATVPT